MCNLNGLNIKLFMGISFSKNVRLVESKHQTSSQTSKIKVKTSNIGTLSMILAISID